MAEGELRFDQSELTVEAGTVRFRFNNTESMPHEAAGMTGT